MGQGCVGWDRIAGVRGEWRGVFGLDELASRNNMDGWIICTTKLHSPLLQI